MFACWIRQKTLPYARHLRADYTVQLSSERGGGKEKVDGACLCGKQMLLLMHLYLSQHYHLKQITGT